MHRLKAIQRPGINVDIESSLGSPRDRNPLAIITVLGPACRWRKLLRQTMGEGRGPRGIVGERPRAPHGPRGVVGWSLAGYA